MKHPLLARLMVCVVAVLALLSPLGSAPTSAAITPQGQRGCAPGTAVGGVNRIVNGDFSIDPGPGPDVDPAAGFESGLRNRGTGIDGMGIYPDDGDGGGFSIQTGPRIYRDGTIVGQPFPGDAQRDVPANQKYFYSNPLYKNGATEVLLWRQVVPVASGTTYNFFAYFDNLLVEGVPGVDPLIELRVDGLAAGPAVSVPILPDEWIPIQYAFTTAIGQTSATLEIYDLAGERSGDDFGMTQISLKQCVSGLGVALHSLPAVKNADGTYDVPFVVTVKNYGVDPEPLRNLQVRSNLVPTFSSVGTFKVISISSASLTVNTAFNGGSDTRLLMGNDTLPSSSTRTITFTVRITPGSGKSLKGPFYAQVSATATAGGVGVGVEVSDISTPGLDPDPDDSGNSKDPEENIPTPVFIEELLYLPLIWR